MSRARTMNSVTRNRKSDSGVRAQALASPVSKSGIGVGVGDEHRERVGKNERGLRGPILPSRAGRMILLFSGLRLPVTTTYTGLGSVKQGNSREKAKNFRLCMPEAVTHASRGTITHNGVAAVLSDVALVAFHLPSPFSESRRAIEPARCPLSAIATAQRWACLRQDSCEPAHCRIQSCLSRPELYHSHTHFHHR